MTVDERRNDPGPEVNLTVTVEDFGPIGEGSVDLRPLTVFVGPARIFGLIGKEMRHSGLPGASFRLISDSGFDK